MSQPNGCKHKRKSITSICASRKQQRVKHQSSRSKSRSSFETNEEDETPIEEYKLANERLRLSEKDKQVIIN